MPTTRTRQLVVDQYLQTNAIVETETAPTDMRAIVTDPLAASTTTLLSDATNLVEEETGRRYSITWLADSAGDWTVRFEAIDASARVLGAQVETVTVVTP